MSSALVDRPEGSQARVVMHLRERGALSRADLVALTGLSRATVTSIVAELLGEGRLVELSERRHPNGPPAIGRPAALVAMHRDAGVAIGIDVGKRHLRVVVADLGHEVLAERDMPLPSDISAADTIEQAVALSGAALEDAQAQFSDVIGVGVALPGPLDRITGELGSSTILPGWVGVRAQEAFAARLGLPVVVGNDADLGALAESTWGVAIGVSDFTYVKWATGIGCGLFINGRPYLGASGFAGEIGHFNAGQTVAAFCKCGLRGCLETVAGTEAMLSTVAPLTGPLTVTELVDRAVDGDLVCRRTLADAAQYLGLALAALANILAPSILIVGGPVARAGNIVMDPINDGIRRGAIPTTAERIKVCTTTLGARAEVLGAVSLVIRDPTLAIARNTSVA